MKHRSTLFIAVISLAAYMTLYLSLTNNIFTDNKKETILPLDYNPNSNELHILSYFTFPAPGPLYMKLFCKCIHINSQLNINITYLGDGNTFNLQNMNKRSQKQLKHSGKLMAVSEYITYLTQQYTIEQQKHYIIILFVDGYDVIFQRNYTYVLNQFININKQYSYQNKVIWSVDNNCWPNGNWCDNFLNIAPNETDTIFLNAGGWVGYLYDVNLMFDNFRITMVKHNNNLNDIKSKFTSDQGFYSYHYFENNSNMILDYYSEIFQKNSDQIIFLKENGWYNTKTNHYPSMLHFAGSKGKFFISRNSPELVDLFVSKHIIEYKINGSMDVIFAKNNGTIRTLKYSKICGKMKDLYY